MVLVIAFLVQLALAYPAENATEVEGDSTQSPNTEINTIDQGTIKEKSTGSDTKDKAHKKFHKLTNKNQPTFGFPGQYPIGPNLSGPHQKKTQAFANFPYKHNDSKPDKKHNYMFNLFFGKQPLDIEIVEDKVDDTVLPFHPNHDNMAHKETQFFSPYYQPEHNRDSIQQKFDSFPYDRLAEAYDNRPSNNNNFPAKELEFQPFYNSQEDEHVREMARYEFLDSKMEEFDPYFGSESERMEESVEPEPGFEHKMRQQYVFHPYFGYIPTDELNEDDEVMEEINVNQLFQLDPQRGFVPVSKDGESESSLENRFEPDMDSKSDQFDAMMKDGEQFEQDVPSNDNSMTQQFYDQLRKGENGDDNSESLLQMLKEQYEEGTQYAPDFPYNRQVNEMMFPAKGYEYDRQFEPLISNNNNYNNGPFGNNQFLPPFQQPNPNQFNRLNYFQTTKSSPKPVKAEALKPKAKIQEKTEGDPKIVEVEIKPVETLKREKRTAQTLLPHQVYYSPYNVYPSQYLSHLYQPQYYYNPLVRPDARNSENIITKPIYTMTDAMKVEGGAETRQVLVPVQRQEVDEDNKLPVDLPGANVAQASLGDQYPLFPYDPEQDLPAAEAF